MDGSISPSAIEQPVTRPEAVHVEEAPIILDQVKGLIKDAIHEARITPLPASTTTILPDVPSTPDLALDHDDITSGLAERLITALEESIATKAVQNALSTSGAPHASIQTPLGSPALVLEQSETPQWVNEKDTAVEPEAQGFKEIKEVWNEKTYQYEIVEPAKQLGELDELDGYIFVVRQRVDKRTQDISSHVDIKSTLLRDALGVVFEHIRHIDLRSNKPSIPQNMLFNVLPDLRSYQQNLTPDNQTSSHLNELINFIERMYTDTNCHIQSLLAHGEITYDLLWSLFKPNQLLFTTCSGTHKSRCVRHICGEEKKNMYGAKYWSLDCRYNDFDGKEFGEVSIEVMIPKFQGLKSIHELEAFPIQYHPRFNEVKSELIDCGKRFISLRGAHHRHCKGAAFFLRKGEVVELQVDSRVMVDAAFFKKANPTYPGPKINGAATQRAISVPLFRWGSLFGVENDRNSESGEKTDGIYEWEPTDPTPTPEWHGDDKQDMTDEALMLCCPTVRGFSLKDKMWLEFAVADIERIEWSTDAADCWIAAEEEKVVLLALAEAHLIKEPDHGFDDFIKGKGRGLNVLLHGPPGVGKTLTAEVLAEYLKCPLYSICAGELPPDAGQLEASLSLIFQLAQRWGAILLLDEADVYLEQRSSRDLGRNSLVSVFLRKMEFCEAIVFLTTNRVMQFDEAILSRVHLAMKYGNLDCGRRKLIWTNFLDRADNIHGKADISGRELDELARIELNGRQIKNVVATASALAAKTSRVRYTHLEMAIAAGRKFVDDFYGTNYKTMY